MSCCEVMSSLPLPVVRILEGPRHRRHVQMEAGLDEVVRARGVVARRVGDDPPVAELGRFAFAETKEPKLQTMAAPLRVDAHARDIALPSLQRAASQAGVGDRLGAMIDDPPRDVGHVELRVLAAEAQQVEELKLLGMIFIVNRIDTSSMEKHHPTPSSSSSG